MRIFDMTSYFQDGAYDIRPPLAAASSEQAGGACDVISSLYALQFLIHSTFIRVTVTYSN